MRKYEAPLIKGSRVQATSELSSLSDWLANIGDDFTVDGITTYLIRS